MTRTKRVMTMLTVLALTVALAAPALALGPIDTAMTGSIELKVADETYRDDFAAQEPAAPIEVLVYKLADVDENGLFTPTAAFLPLADNAAWNGGILNDALTDIAALQAAAEELVYGPASEGAEPEAEREPVIPADLTASIDAAGGMVDLAASGLGLYLLIPQKTETALWVYTFNPIMVAVPSVPTRTADPEGGIPAEGDWLYAVSLELKAERESRLVALEIEKYLATYNRNLGPASFVFDVVGRDDAGNVVYQSTERLTFDDMAGPTQRVRVENIPAGCTVTVTEVYTGQSYSNTDGTVKVVVMDPGTLPEGEDAQRVAFSNDYTGGRTPDASVENVFTMNDQGGWIWHSESGNEEAAG